MEGKKTQRGETIVLLWVVVALYCEMAMDNGHRTVLLKKLPGDEGREMPDVESNWVLVWEHAQCIRLTGTH